MPALFHLPVLLVLTCLIALPTHALPLDGTYKGVLLSNRLATNDKRCTGNNLSQSYELTFDVTWSSATHPYDIPEFPHFSIPIGATHNSQYRIWQPGDLASVGIEAMAESGNASIIFEDVNEQITQGNAGSAVYKLPGFDSPDRFTLNFSTTPDFPLLTITSMLAPSPDWFIGIHDYNLCQNGHWIDYAEITLYAYDAGTDSGTTYLAEDDDTQPRELIHRIETLPFLVNGQVVPVGKLILSTVE